MLAALRLQYNRDVEMIDTEPILQTRIADKYRRLIQSGRFRRGERLPTVRKLAAQMAISVTPVKAAFRKLEEEGLVCRRRGAGTFVGNLAISVPAELEIGVIFRPVRGWTRDDNYGLRLFLGIQNALQRGHHRNVLATLAHSRERLTEVPRQFIEHPPHAYVLDERIPSPLVELLVSTGRPTVVVNRPCEVAGAGSVYRDFVQAGTEVARRILEHRHRIAACIHRPQWNGTEVAAAFSSIMAEAGCAVPDTHTGAVDFQGPSANVEAVFADLMRHEPFPTVVFCTDDPIARAFIRWADRRGLRVPQDISVVGILDLAMARNSVPPLTTFRFAPERIGEAAVAEAVACCREPFRSPRRVTVAGEWVERQSLTWRPV